MMKWAHIFISIIVVMWHLVAMGEGALSLKQGAQSYKRVCDEQRPLMALLDEILVRQFAQGLSKPLRRPLADCDEPGSITLLGSKMLLKCYREEEEKRTAICLEANMAEKLLNTELSDQELESEFNLDDIKCEVVKK